MSASLRAAIAPRTPRRIAIASGKGGVGKTWLAITLAHALARAGRDVVLFDGDLGLANADVQLGLVPEADIARALETGLPLAACAARVESTGFRLIAGRSGDATLASLDRARIGRLLAGIASLDAGMVLLDLGAGLDRPVRAMAASADTLLVVATEDPASITDAHAVLKWFFRDAGGADARIVVNQAANETAGERTYQALARASASFLGVTPPLAGIVRRDPRVAEAIRAQTPLLTRHPAAPAATDVTKLAAALTC